VSGACRSPPGSATASVAGPFAAPDLFADVEHRRLVALALANDDRAVEADVVHRAAHRFHRRFVGVVVVAVTHPVVGRDRRGLGDTHEIEAGGAVEGLRRLHRRLT
jgi:hypothetical protein